MITISLDVTLLDKSRFKEIVRKNGKKAIFCDLVLLETPQSEYGDYMVKQSITKEEREAKLEMPILGSGKKFGAKPKQSSPDPSDKGPDCPF